MTLLANFVTNLSFDDFAEGDILGIQFFQRLNQGSVAMTQLLDAPRYNIY